MSHDRTPYLQVLAWASILTLFSDNCNTIHFVTCLSFGHICCHLSCLWPRATSYTLLILLFALVSDDRVDDSFPTLFFPTSHTLSPLISAPSTTSSALPDSPPHLPTRLPRRPLSLHISRSFKKCLSLFTRVVSWACLFDLSTAF